MASKVASDEDGMCFSCSDIFQPILLSCGHTFCKGCLQQTWTQRGRWSCPLCRRPSSLELPVDGLLESLCSDQRLQSSCGQHAREQLRFFCHTDNKLVCAICVTSREHEDHKYTSAEKAAQEYKGILGEMIEPLQEHVKVLQNAHKTYDEAVKNLKAHVSNAEREISVQLGTLHRFLHIEELSRMAVLRTEEDQNIRRMRQNKEEISEEIKSLLEKIEILENEVGKDDLLFLQHLNSTLDRTRHAVKPEISCDPFMDIDKHLQNLQYRVWEKMKEVILQSEYNVVPEGPKFLQDLDSPGPSAETGRPSLHPGLPTPASLSNPFVGFSPTLMAAPLPHQPCAARVFSLRRTLAYPTDPNYYRGRFLPDCIRPRINLLRPVRPPFIYVPDNVPYPPASGLP